MGRHRRWGPKETGSYYTEFWRYTWDSVSSRHVYTPERPSYRECQVVQKTGDEPDPDYGPMRTYRRDTLETLTEDEIRDTEFTLKNSTPGVRHEQAKVLAHLDYGGPVSGGEARALKRLFTELGKPDLVKHGWVLATSMVMRPPTARQQRHHRWWGTPPPPATKVETSRLQNCYVFKSPIEGVTFDKFVRLARMYKDDSGQLRKAVLAVLANPEAHKEIETLDTLEILGGMTGL